MFDRAPVRSISEAEIRANGHVLRSTFVHLLQKTEKLSLTKVSSDSECREVLCCVFYLSSFHSIVFLSLGKSAVVKPAEWHKRMTELK